MKKFLFAANWKMNMPFVKAVQFAQTHAKELHTLATPAKEIVICPSFVALYPVAQILEKTAVAVGAQDCSPYEHGSYTGEVDAQSLKEVGCRYCIVGHSERRQYFRETSDMVAQKVACLLKAHVTPIICVGETKEQYGELAACAVLEEQLEPVIAILQKKSSQAPFCIAYEPVWAIGTGTVPTQTYLEKVLTWLNLYIGQRTQAPYYLIYGGSIDETNARQFFDLPLLKGLLIGGSSLDFQKFQKIVSLVK